MNGNSAIDRSSLRSRQARLGSAIGSTGYKLLCVMAILSLGCGIALQFFDGTGWAELLLALAVQLGVIAKWYALELRPLPISGSTANDRLASEVLSRLPRKGELNPQTVWKALATHWQSYFFTNHLLLTGDAIANCLTTSPADLANALAIATGFADQLESDVIEVGFVIYGLLQSSPAIASLMRQQRLQISDLTNVAEWLGRELTDMHRTKQSFGGIGRDWAFGFTPLLNRYGENVSLAITHYGAHFGALTASDGVKNIEAAFDNHAGAVALIGPDGIGKTSHVYALAQRMIEGQSSQKLTYHQIISLNAGTIISSARGPGDLEHILLSLANEAAHAGHVILFFDDAQLFFHEGTGTFDASQILLPIVQSHSVPLIFALQPSIYQQLRATNSALATALTPITLVEQTEANIMRVLEDSAGNLEGRHRLLISYQAVREAYRLSGRYEQDEAYPGKAIKLLEQSIAHAAQNIVTDLSVQQAIEQSRGVKVSQASAAETDTLLHLEDAIHKRMINQSQAVTVVSNALRRARAGVANPRRPIGSFLFLGPTGVGKTELAKAIAATYFGDEQSMIRLDMSEYQQPDDVQRLLSGGLNESNSLILAVRQQPFSVVLLDEIEKAHPNVLNLLLQLLDEGQLTDASGRAASFKDCVVIATSNAGATTIRERVASGQDLEAFKDEFTDTLINSGQFKPELINRFDELVLFRPLDAGELAQVVRLMLIGINQTLANQNISVSLTDTAVAAIVEHGNDPRLGARPMRRTLQRAVEDTIANRILRGETQPGDQVTLDAPDLML
jgi:ATP-dependent Clp protease ATP-binding subunit ClpA